MHLLLALSSMLLVQMIGSIGLPVSAFSTGFAIGLSLIMAIGAQNSFVLRQGLMRRHVFTVALFCAGSDALLIAIGCRRCFPVHYS